VADLSPHGPAAPGGLPGTEAGGPGGAPVWVLLTVQAAASPPLLALLLLGLGNVHCDGFSLAEFIPRFVRNAPVVAAFALLAQVFFVTPVALDLLAQLRLVPAVIAGFAAPRTEAGAPGPSVRRRFLLAYPPRLLFFYVVLRSYMTSYCPETF